MGRGRGGILSTLKIKQKGFCPKKGFGASWKIYGRDSVHLVKMSGRDYIHVAKNMGGIMSTYTKMSRRDYVREGFCPTLAFGYLKNVEKKKQSQENSHGKSQKFGKEKASQC